MVLAVFCRTPLPKRTVDDTAPTIRFIKPPDDSLGTGNGVERTAKEIVKESNVLILGFYKYTLVVIYRTSNELY